MGPPGTNAPQDLWSLARINFEHDDGSLPGVGLTDLTPSQVVAICALLEAAGQIARPDDPPTYWDKASQSAKPIRSMTAAATEIAAERAEPSHILLQSVRFEGVPIPNLGVFVFPDSIFLDYRKGPDWTREAVMAFFRLFHRMRDITPQSRIDFDSTFGDQAAFLAAWTAFLASTSLRAPGPNGVTKP